MLCFAWTITPRRVIASVSDHLVSPTSNHLDTSKVSAAVGSSKYILEDIPGQDAAATAQLYVEKIMFAVRYREHTFKNMVLWLAKETYAFVELLLDA